MICCLPDGPKDLFLMYVNQASYIVLCLPLLTLLQCAAKMNIHLAPQIKSQWTKLKEDLTNSIVTTTVLCNIHCFRITCFEQVTIVRLRSDHFRLQYHRSTKFPTCHSVECPCIHLQWQQDTYCRTAPLIRLVTQNPGLLTPVMEGLYRPERSLQYLHTAVFITAISAPECSKQTYKHVCAHARMLFLCLSLSHTHTHTHTHTHSDHNF